MRNNLLYIVSILLLLTACQKAPINGDLDGQWQIMSVSPEPVEKPIPARLYYCFNLHTCQLTSYGEGVWTSGNFTFTDNLLTMEFPYIEPTSELGQKKLRQFGINTNPVTFTIKHLDKNSLILQNGETTVTLRKF